MFLFPTHLPFLHGNNKEMSEFIIIQVGQCGNQIGGALWPLILQEYNIKLNSNNNNNNKLNNDELQSSINSFFHMKHRKSYENLQEMLQNNVRARAVCIDMEDSVVSRFKTGQLGNLFDRRCLITNYPGSGNNWAEGNCEHGPKYEERILRAIQQAAERCDSLHGFLLLFSTGGGTGSGLGTFVLKLLATHYPQIERFVACVYPTGTEDVITCPYNMAFATRELLEYATCVFPVENRALLNILSRKRADLYLDSNNLNMFSPFNDMNSIVVEMLLNLTSGCRFPGSLNFDMNELNTNMVPFPKLNFLSCGFGHNNRLERSTKPVSKQLKDELFIASYSRLNQLTKIDPLSPKSVLIAATLQGRGDYSLADMRSYVDKLQSKAHFTPWSQKAVKLSLCDVPPYQTRLSMFGLFNTSSMAQLFQHINGQFCKLYQKKAHVHHYTKIDNFDESWFAECKSDLFDIITAYREVETMEAANIPRLTAII